MKQLTCEMCGGTDLMKQDGAFVCQNCGMKYSVEEAKKMMIEGTVDVQGTVKVDNSAFVERYLQNARRAKQKEDWPETEKYYNMIKVGKDINSMMFISFGLVIEYVRIAQQCVKCYSSLCTYKNTSRSIFLYIIYSYIHENKTGQTHHFG